MVLLKFLFQDSYKMFGVDYQADDAIIRPLESLGFRRLYPHNYDPKRELKKLNHSMLINFLDILDIMIKAPDSAKRSEKIEDLNLLFIHMHHLINEFRPHQARETLRVMLEVQKKQRLETTNRFTKHLSRVQEVLRQAVAALPDDSSLDSKLVIKNEPMDCMMIKTEPVDSDEPEVNPLNRMMCDIVDNMKWDN